MPSSERKPIISGNWKMNHNHFEAIQTVQKLGYLLSKDDYEAVDVSIHPPFTDLRSVQTTAESDDIPIIVGAQNCHWEDSGAFTGEVSPAFLAKLNVKYVIVGHSERRELFGETDEWVERKVKAVFKHQMTPILCVGETLEEREADGARAKVTGQVEAGLVGLSGDQVASMVIAYEPIWAIGTGRAATSQQAQDICGGTVRAAVAELFGDDVAQATRILYGGSTNAKNIGEIMQQPDIDGALIGGASLQPDSYASMVKTTAEVYR